MKEDGQITSLKPLVFLLDDPNKKEKSQQVKEEKKKGKKTKASQAAVTMKNFGAKASVSVFKSATNLQLAWRCRCPCWVSSFKTMLIQIMVS